MQAVLGMASAQIQAGQQVRILATDEWYDTRPVIPGCEIKIFHSHIPGWQWSPALSRALAKEVEWADVVNIHTVWSYVTWAGARASFAARVPYILRPCGMLDVWSMAQNQWKKKLYAAMIEGRNIRKAAALWFTSEEERNSARSFNYGASDFVIPLGVSVSDYLNPPAPGTFRKRFLSSSNERILLFMGRINPVKQLDLLIRSFAQLVDEFSDTVLVIAGPDENEHTKQLKSLTDSLGINEKVLFTGGLQKADVVAALFDAECFILPSLHENFGVAVVEAMAAGTPVIVSDRVGLAQFVSESRSGMVTKADLESFTSSIRFMLDNPVLAAEMGMRGRELALRHFNWETLVPRITAAYQTTINGNASKLSGNKSTCAESQA